jgi:hypothetical protein
MAPRANLAFAVAAFAVAPIAFAPIAYGQSAADLETARALFKEGKELRARGDLRGAVEKLRAAHAAGRTPITGLELARTHALLGELVEAREVALGVARIPVAADETERSAEARAEASRLAEEVRERIPDVTVHLAGVPAGAAPEVTVDGHSLPPPLVGEPFKVDPGLHVIAVAGAGAGAQSSATVTLAERESKHVTLAYAGPAPGPQAPSAALPVDAPPPAEGATFVYGASLALVPSYFLRQDVDTLGRTDQPEFGIGVGVEVGASLAPGFEVLARAMASAGTKGKPVSSLLGAGPGMSFRIGRRWWIGATLYTGRGDMNFEGKAYSTDWVFASTLDISFAAIEWRSGQWLVSVSPGYFFANHRQDNQVLFVPLSFGYRSN